MRLHGPIQADAPLSASVLATGENSLDPPDEAIVAAIGDADGTWEVSITAQDAAACAGPDVVLGPSLHVEVDVDAAPERVDIVTETVGGCD